MFQLTLKDAAWSPYKSEANMMDTLSGGDYTTKNKSPESIAKNQLHKI